MISWEEAARIVDRETSGEPAARETLPVREALGRTLAADHFSRLDLPPFNKSAMDGFAVAGGGGAYRVVETVAAGSTPRRGLNPGTAVRVMTGAPVPEGAVRVIRLEDASEEGGILRVVRESSEANICPRGEDLKIGDRVLGAGTRLSPVDLANLVACGLTQAEVFRPLRLAILSTGDELADDPAKLGPGRIMNANGPLLRSLARRHGLEVAGEATVSDDPDKTLRALREALERAPLVAVSGGVSAGDFDYVGGALSRAGLRVHFTRVAVKPGLPTTFASAPGKAVFGLPGNPVAVFAMFELFVLRAASRLLGLAAAAPRELRLPLSAAFRRRKTERDELVACRVLDGALTPVDFHGSAHLMALSRADGFFVVPAGAAELAAGSAVRFLPLSLMEERR